jgi:hypothetical protein
VDGAILAEATTSLEVIDPPGQRKRPLVAPAPPLTGEPRPSSPPLSAEQKERAERLLAQGRRLWEDGNVAGARNSFERAFQEGLVTAAIDMAKTFDRAELALMEVMGLKPEPDAAIKWYHRALTSGVLEAREPLARSAVKWIPAEYARPAAPSGCSQSAARGRRGCSSPAVCRILGCQPATTGTRL